MSLRSPRERRLKAISSGAGGLLTWFPLFILRTARRRSPKAALSTAAVLPLVLVGILLERFILQGRAGGR